MDADGEMQVLEDQNSVSATLISYNSPQNWDQVCGDAKSVSMV